MNNLTLDQKSTPHPGENIDYQSLFIWGLIIFTSLVIFLLTLTRGKIDEELFYRIIGEFGIYF
ncbi:MAG: hypothetical protein WD098_05605 [Balneolales bacterium]